MILKLKSKIRNSFPDITNYVYCRTRDTNCLLNIAYTASPIMIGHLHGYVEVKEKAETVLLWSNSELYVLQETKKRNDELTIKHERFFLQDIICFRYEENECLLKIVLPGGVFKIPAKNPKKAEWIVEIVNRYLYVTRHTLYMEWPDMEIVDME